MDFITKMMKRMLMVTIILACSWGINGCNSEQFGVPMSAIRADAERCDSYASMMVETDSVEIIKRQTNAESKEDLVYVSIKGKNEYYEVVRNYKMRYLLYNDGWMLEEMTEYSDAENIDITTPIKECIDMDGVQAFLDASDMTAFTSFVNEDYPSELNLKSFAHTGIEKASVDLKENYGRVVYICSLAYEYYCFTEYVEVPVECCFSTYDGSWSMNFDNQNIVRSVKLNNRILGVWGGHDLFNRSQTNVRVFSFEGDTCNVEYINSEGFYRRGEMKIDSIYIEEWGRYSALYLRWEPEDGDGEYDLLITGVEAAGNGKYYYTINAEYDNFYCLFKLG